MMHAQYMKGMLGTNHFVYRDSSTINLCSDKRDIGQYKHLSHQKHYLDKFKTNKTFFSLFIVNNEI